MLINEGDIGDSLYIILSGRVKVYASNEAGREFVIDFHGPGEYVGEMSLDGSPRSASVITVEPTTCAIVNRAHFRDFVLAHPDFALHLIQKLIRRVRLTTENVKSLALSDVYGRSCKLFNALAEPVDGKMVVRERLTQQDIAERVGASRDMIGKLMKDLVGRRLPRGGGPHDHHPQEAAARLVSARGRLPSARRRIMPSASAASADVRA